MSDTDTPLIRVISFGYGHTGALDDDGTTVLAPPAADLALDLRQCSRNPHRDPRMRHLTGLDQVVFDHVMATPGAQLLAHQIAVAAHALVHQARPPLFTVSSGCVGGRHRAVGMAREVFRVLSLFAVAGGYRVELVHRDVHRDVLGDAVHV